ncbi:MAG: transposon-encoded TnpW family protein [Oscillospiraceae bacterium]|nr:transposon-encoded TnpW family protein [Oscillospiraceae bacterium]MDD4414715.1 transposon-encoded TnpW family protein [Oscillospiraceae bacterium]
MTKAESKREYGAFTKRIGYTNYHVGVYFSDTSTETAKDKILRLVKNEAENEKAAKNQ